MLYWNLKRQTNLENLLTFKAHALTSLLASSTSSTNGVIALNSRAVYFPLVVIAILKYNNYLAIQKITWLLTHHLLYIYAVMLRFDSVISDKAFNDKASYLFGVEPFYQEKYA